MANIVLLKKSSVSGKIPLVTDLDYGEVALNYADGLLYYKKSDNTIKSIGGGNSSSSTFTAIDHKSYTATSGQTSFNVAYTAPYVNVYVNGSRLNAADYTATSGTSITLASGAIAGDEVELVGFTGTVLSLTGATSGQVVTATGSGSLQFTTLGTLSTQNSSSVTITGGTINGTSIGATTPSTGNFTTLSGSAVIIDTFSTLDSATATTTATTANQVIASFSTSTYSTVKFVIQAIDSTSGKYHSTEILAVSNGTIVNYTEYASINITGICATYSMDVSGGLIRLLATPSSANSTVFKISLTLIAS